jgi:hypothetical protein
MADSWTENLRCATCRKIGTVHLSRIDGDYAPTVHGISGGFNVVQTEYGPDFLCATCNVAAER